MKYIYIGYIFIFFHIRINGFDLLANFIGYALIYAGLNQLSELSAHFRKAKPWSVGMGIVALLDCIAGLIGYTYSAMPFILLNLITIIVSAYILFQITAGICETEEKTGLTLNSSRLMLLWKIQTALSASCTVLSLIAANNILLIIAAALTLAAVVTNILYLIQLHRISKAMASD